MERNRSFLLRFTEEEFRLLTEYAEKDAQTHTKKTKEKNISAYIRKCIFSSARHPWGLKKELNELAYQVRKIGVNINQVVTKINSGYGTAYDIGILKSQLAEVEDRMKGVESRIEEIYGDHKTDAYQSGQERDGGTFKEQPPVYLKPGEDRGPVSGGRKCRE